MKKILFLFLMLTMAIIGIHAQNTPSMDNKERARVIHNLICRMRPIPVKEAGSNKVVYRQVITPTPVTNYEWWAVMSEKLYKDNRQASQPAIVRNAHPMTNLLTYEKKRDMVFIVADANQIKQARQAIGLQGGINSKGTSQNEEFFIVTFYDEWKKYTGKK